MIGMAAVSLEDGFGNFHLLVVVFLSIGLPLAGLLCLRLTSGLIGELLVLASLAVLGAIGAAGAVLGYPSGAWLPLVVLAGVGGLIQPLASTHLLGPGLPPITWLRSLPHLLLLGGPVLGWCWAEQLETWACWELEDACATSLQRPLTPLVPHGQASTDRGRPVVLFTTANRPASAYATRLWEETALKTRSLSLQVIKTAGADSCANCHGWVFAGGDFVIQNEQVHSILEDNGYLPVSIPQAGDLIIYRTETGQIIHSGIVRLSSHDPLMLVESKWGMFGRYVHHPDNQPYGTNYTFYRSQRRGHTLHGLDRPGRWQ